MTRDASFKKVVRRHAEETGQRYTEALTDLEGLGARIHHEPVPERLLAHLRDRYGVDALVVRATPPSSDSWSGRSILPSAWRPTMRYLTSMAVRRSYMHPITPS